MSLIRVAYSSKRIMPFDQAALGRYVESAYELHSRLGLTGAIAHSAFSLFHVIEGFAGDVDAALEAFKSDIRHVEVAVVLRRPIESRRFGQWCLGVTPVPMDWGFEQRVEDDRELAGLGWGRASRLLVALERGDLSRGLESAGDAIAKGVFDGVGYETVPLIREVQAHAAF